MDPQAQIPGGGAMNTTHGENGPEDRYETPEYVHRRSLDSQLRAERPYTWEYRFTVAGILRFRLLSVRILFGVVLVFVICVLGLGLVIDSPVSQTAPGAFLQYGIYAALVLLTLWLLAVPSRRIAQISTEELSKSRPPKIIPWSDVTRVQLKGTRLRITTGRNRFWATMKSDPEEARRFIGEMISDRLVS